MENTPNGMVKLLNTLYNRATEGVVGSKPISELASDYLIEASYDREKAAQNLIKNQLIKCTLSGAASGLGGFTTSLFTVPANIVNVLYVQIRMIAALAYIGGYDTKSDQVQTAVYACLIGNTLSNLIKEPSIKLAETAAIQIIKAIPKEILKKINETIGKRLLTKFGSKGIINLGKFVPLFGAAVGGLFDYGQTKHIADKAYQQFILTKPAEDGTIVIDIDS